MVISMGFSYTCHKFFCTISLFFPYPSSNCRQTVFSIMDVTLYVYDLSRGLARQLSQQLLGVHIDAMLVDYLTTELNADEHKISYCSGVQQHRVFLRARDSDMSSWRDTSWPAYAEDCPWTNPASNGCNPGLSGITKDYLHSRILRSLFTQLQQFLQRLFHVLGWEGYSRSHHKPPTDCTEYSLWPNAETSIGSSYTRYHPSTCSATTTKFCSNEWHNQNQDPRSKTDITRSVYASTRASSGVMRDTLLYLFNMRALSYML